MAVSSITAAEFRFGAHRRRSKSLHESLDRSLGSMAYLPFDAAAAARSGQVAAGLAAAGRPIRVLDTMAGAHALQLGAIFVTHNLRHLRFIPGPALEDWP